MALTHDTNARIPATALSTTTSAASASYTCGANAKLLVVMVCYAGTTQRTGGAPTYNGVALTQISTKQGVTEASCELWYLLDPPVGQSLVVNVPNDNGVTMWAYVSSANAGPGNSIALDSSGVAATTGANPTVTIANVLTAGCLIYAVVATGNNTFAPTARTGTSLYEEDIATYGSGAQYYVKADTGGQAMSWTEATSDDYGAIAAAFKEVVNLSVNVNDNIGVSDAPAASIPILAVMVFSLIGLTDVAEVTRTPLEIDVSENIGLTDDAAIPLWMGVYHSKTFAIGENLPHAALYLSGYLYVGLRTSPGKLLKINAANLSDYSVLTFPNDGQHDKIGQIRYSTSKARIYVLFEEGTRTVVAEVNPSDLSQSDVINNTYSVGGGSFCLDETSLFVVARNWNKLFQYNMTTWAEGQSVSIDNYGHACEYDSGFVYITHFNTPGSVTKVQVSDFSLTTQAFASGDNSPTDDLAIVGNYLWVGLEATNGHILKIAKSDLSITVIDTGQATASYGVQYDGTWLWAVYNGTPGWLVRIDPSTNEIETYKFDYNSPNEIVFNGQFLYITTYESPFTLLEGSLTTIHEADVFDNINLQDQALSEIPVGSILNVNVFDAIGVSDELESKIDPYLAFVFSSLVVTDDVQVVINPLSANVFDAIGITDEPSISIPVLQVDVFDSVGVSDQPLISIPILLVSVFDSAGLSDEVQVALTSYEIGVNELLSVGDGASAALGLYEVSVNDALNCADAVAQSIPVLEIAVYDSVGLSEFVSASIPVLEVSTSDGIGLSDDVVLSVPVLEIVVYDSIGLSDEGQISLSNVLEVSVFDLVHIHPAFRNPDVFDSAAVSDAVNVSIPVLQVSVADSIVVSDEVAANLIALWQVNVNDAVVVADEAVLVIPMLEISVADDIGLSDSVAAELALYEVWISDNIGVADDPSIEITGAGLLTVSVYDDLAVTDQTLTSVPVLLAFVVDDLSITDDATAQLNVYLVSIFDSITLTDVAATQFNLYLVSVSDSVTVQEDVTSLLNVLWASVFDELAVTDNVQLSVPVLLISVFDSVALQDGAISLLDVLLASVFDSIGLTDQPTVEIIGAGLLTVSVYDDLAVTDQTLTSMPVLVLSVADDLSITEDVTTQLNLYLVSIFDSIGLTDQPTIEITGAGILTISAYDDVSVTDQPLSSIPILVIAVADDLSMTDDTTAQLNLYLVSIFESVGLTDSISASLDLLLAGASDNVAVQDHTTGQLMEPPEPPPAIQFIEEALYALIRSATAVEELIAGRIYPFNLPQGTAVPAIVYQQIGETEELTTDGALGLIEAGFQFNCFGSTHAESIELAESLRSCLNDYEGTIGKVIIAHIRVNDERDIPMINQDVEQMSRFGRLLNCQVSYSV